MLAKLRLEKREPAELAAADRGEVEDVDGVGEGDDGAKAVFRRRRELRGWRGWNWLVEGIVVVVVVMFCGWLFSVFVLWCDRVACLST